MGKRFLFVFLLIQTFVNRHKKHLLVGSVAGFFLTLIFIQLYPYYSRLTAPKTQIIGLVGRINEGNLPIEIRNKISVGLTSLLPTGDATSSLAINWDISSNGLTYTFHLIDNIFWHDGIKFVSRDVNYKLKGVTFTYPDDKTVIATLKEPYAPLPVNLSTPLIKEGYIGLGLYKAIRTQYQGGYLSEIAMQPVRSESPPLTYKFYSNTEDAILAYKLGEVNTLQNITKINDLNLWKNTKISKNPQYDKVTLIFFNLKNSLFKEKEIRQALTYAVPPIEGFEKAYSPISPRSWAYTQKIRLYKYDPETSTKILSKSAISSTSGELTLSTYSSLLDTAQLVSDAWNKIGVKTKVKIESSIPQDFQLFLLTLSIPADPDQYQYWQTMQENTNIAHYSNLKIDKLLEDGRKTLDKEKRVKIYADFQRYLVDDAPVIFLTHPNLYQVERK